MTVIKQIKSPKITIIFDILGKLHKVEADKGEDILKIAHSNKLQLEGACEGSLACSTCHVILPRSLYNKLQEPSDKEYDLLDQAFQPTSTSRLGCQVKIDDIFNNCIIKIPTVTRNLAVDGFKPKPH